MSKQHDAVMCMWYNFYPRLEELCEAWGINNKTLSIKAGISPATISKWKASYEETYGVLGVLSDRNITVPGVESLISLSLYFNCSTDYLIGTRVDWKAEQIDRIIGRLSAENKEKLLEHAKLLLLKQEHDEENE